MQLGHTGCPVGAAGAHIQLGHTVPLAQQEQEIGQDQEQGQEQQAQQLDHEQQQLHQRRQQRQPTSNTDSDSSDSSASGSSEDDSSVSLRDAGADVIQETPNTTAVVQRVNQKKATKDPQSPLRARMRTNRNSVGSAA